MVSADLLYVTANIESYQRIMPSISPKRPMWDGVVGSVLRQEDEKVPDLVCEKAGFQRTSTT